MNEEDEVFTIFIQSEFIPEWNGNKDRNNPIVIEHRAPTMNLRNRLMPRPKVDLKISAEGKSEGGQAVLTVDNNRIVREMVTGIRNFRYKTVRPDNTEKEFKVERVEHLLSDDSPSAFGDLIDEIGSYFQTLLMRKIDTKNSE